MPNVPAPSILLDEKRAHEIRDLMHEADADAYKKMLDSLVRDAATFAGALRAHVAGAPVDAIKRTAHGLKGASHGVGARAMGDLFSELEHLASVDDIPAVVRRHAQSSLLIEQSLAALRRLDVAA